MHTNEARQERLTDEELDMPEKDGYKSIDLVIKEIGASEQRVRIAIAALNIQSYSFPTDRRHRFYSKEDIQRIKEWLATH